MLLSPLARLLPVIAGLLFWATAPFAAGPAEERWALCPPMETAPPVAKQEPEVITLFSDQATAEGESRSVFSGNVVVIRDGKQLEADQAIYDKQQDTLDVNGHVSLFGDAIAFQGESAHINLADTTGQIHGASYRVQAMHGFGTAERVDVKGEGRSEFTGATFTTCPPGHEAWKLNARTLRLDRPSNTGEAYHVAVELSGVPVFYLPYINFPLEGRKSGLLVPSFGTSQRNGTDLSIPWYWNIAPDRDATLTPRIISNRGGMLMSEFRYLNPTNRGQLNLDALPNDKLFNGKTRSYARLQHTQGFSERWNANLDLANVSDLYYFDHIDNTLATASALYLERRFDLTYRGDGWNFLGRLQNFQSLQVGSDPGYERRPQLLANGGGRRGVWRYDFSTEYANFASSSRKPTGSRIDLYPGISAPFGGEAWFITPRIAARSTQYELRNATASATPHRTLPIASLDSGLFFERELSLFATPLVQTLEPRLYYLRVPYADQSNLPLFDTDAMTFSFDQLFRENRFSGPDRMGDANQITAALTTRFLRGDSGAEAVRASIGQIHYFSDRKVSLTGTTPETRRSSDIAGELAGHPIPEVEISGATRWNPQINNAEESSARIRYRSDRRHLIDVAWHYRNAGNEMNRDLLVLWPITPRWHAVGRWYYDLVNRRTVEDVIGLEYESCCWSVRVVTRDKPFPNSTTQQLQSDRSIYFTLELKGLANIGSSLESVIDNGMVGL